MRKIIVLMLIKIFMVIGMFPFYSTYDDVGYPNPTPTPTYSLLIKNPIPMPTPTPWDKPKCDPSFLPYPYDQQDCWFRIAPPRR